MAGRPRPAPPSRPHVNQDYQDPWELFGIQVLGEILGSGIRAGSTALQGVIAPSTQPGGALWNAGATQEQEAQFARQQRLANERGAAEIRGLNTSSAQRLAEAEYRTALTEQVVPAQTEGLLADAYRTRVESETPVARRKDEYKYRKKELELIQKQKLELLRLQKALRARRVAARKSRGGYHVLPDGTVMNAQEYKAKLAAVDKAAKLVTAGKFGNERTAVQFFSKAGDEASRTIRFLLDSKSFPNRDAAEAYADTMRRSDVTTDEPKTLVTPLGRAREAKELSRSDLDTARAAAIPEQLRARINATKTMSTDRRYSALQKLRGEVLRMRSRGMLGGTDQTYRPDLEATIDAIDQELQALPVSPVTETLQSQKQSLIDALGDPSRTPDDKERYRRAIRKINGQLGLPSDDGLMPGVGAGGAP